MKATCRRAALLVAALATSANAETGKPPEPGKPRATLPLRYGTACPSPGDPRQITIADSLKGPVVTFERPDLGTPETRDDNLAFVSRRFFFKLKTDTELIEFQGHARDDELEGLLSDVHGARHIALPVVPAGAEPKCGDRP